jgi:hypothetical protein
VSIGNNNQIVGGAKSRIEKNAKELDQKAFAPRAITLSGSFSSYSNISTLVNELSFPTLDGNHTPKSEGSGNVRNGNNSDPDYYIAVGEDFVAGGSAPVSHVTAKVPAASSGAKGVSPILTDKPKTAVGGEAKKSATPPAPIVKTLSGGVSVMQVPSWEPIDSFSYPIAKVEVKTAVPSFVFADFEDPKHIADGSNSNIFLGKLKGNKVIIKMIKEDVMTNVVAVHEFEVEHGMLCRCNHPNIIRLLGLYLFCLIFNQFDSYALNM